MNQPTNTVTSEEQGLMLDIAKRASLLAKKNGVEYKQVDAFLDIYYAHKSTPIDLEHLLAADNGNFGHDVFGIRRHMVRENYKLGSCFLPRFAKKVAA